MITSNHLHRCLWTVAAWASTPAYAWAAATAPPSSELGRWLSLPLVLMAAIALHIVLGRSIKIVLSKTQPLAGEIPEIAGYQRSVYGTCDRSMREIVGLVIAAGVLFWLGLVLVWPWLLGSGGLVLAATLALDLLRWERVTVSADCIWFQRGLGQKIYQVHIDNVRDVTVAEATAQGYTLRHGRRNKLCRLNLRMLDKRVVALPKTDAYRNLAAVKATARQIETRKQLAENHEAAPADFARAMRAQIAEHDSPDTVPASRAIPRITTQL